MITFALEIFLFEIFLIILVSDLALIKHQVYALTLDYKITPVLKEYIPKQTYDSVNVNVYVCVPWGSHKPIDYDIFLICSNISPIASLVKSNKHCSWKIILIDFKSSFLIMFYYFFN